MKTTRNDVVKAMVAVVTAASLLSCVSLKKRQDSKVNIERGALYKRQDGVFIMGK